MKSVCETGFIRSVNNGMATVRLVGDAACRKCGLGELGLCKTGGAGMEIEARCPISVKPGQKVKVVRGGRTYSDGGFLLYGLPVAALIMGALAGDLLAPSVGMKGDAGAAIGGFLLMCISFLPIWLVGRKREKQERFVPTVEELDPWHEYKKPAMQGRKS